MKIVIGYDGGIKSRVAAAILREQGNDVYGVYVTKSGSVPAEIVADAKADGIFFTDVFGDSDTTEGVITALCNHLRLYGFSAVATGHIAKTSTEGRPHFERGSDLTIDDSEKLGRVSGDLVWLHRFPLGEMTAEEINAYAEKLGIHGTVAAKKHLSNEGKVKSFRTIDLAYQKGEAPDPVKGYAMHYCHSFVSVGEAAPVEAHAYVHQLAGYGVVADVIFIEKPSYASVGDNAVLYDETGAVLMGGEISAILD